MPYVNAHHERISLAGKDLDLIHAQWLDVVSVRLDYSHCVVVDGERPIWITGNGNKAEAVPTAQVISSHSLLAGRWSSPLPLLDIDNSKRRKRSTSPTTRAVNERTIEGREKGCIG
jgi:hypothetical protein